MTTSGGSQKKPDNRGARGRSGRDSANEKQYVTRIVPVMEVCRVSAKYPGGEQRAGWVARQQLNLVTTGQLRAAGISDGMICTRRKRGTLHRIHQGVYLFGTDVLLPGAPELAAVLALGDGARVRRRSALSLLGVIPSWRGDVEVTVAGGGPRSRPGIAVHRVTELPRQDRSWHNGIPIVSPALALLEFASVATGDELEQAIAEAYALKLVNERALRKVLERYPRVAGAPALRAELDRVGGPKLTRRQAARKMKLLIRDAQLPPPLTEQWIEGFRVDFYWPQFRLIVEVDGFQYHGHRYAFENDRRRDQAHVAYQVLRFSWRHLTEEAYRVVAVIAMAIGAATERSAGAA
jgi:very-short-patch-repair endonuclease